ncbi:MAG: N-acetyltransferase family protein [Bacillota bacterium]
MIIRKATEKDIPAIAGIYDEIHDREAAGETTTGWLRGVYPTRETAEASVERDDMFVQKDDQGNVVGTAIINKLQVDCYSLGDWEYPAPDDEVMVIHTLIISGKEGRRGSGKHFIQFYEDYAKAEGCPYLRLDTNARNQAARDFYKKLGYREIGKVPTIFNGIPGVDLVLIEKRL